jgi:hypothetical protein
MGSDPSNAIVAAFEGAKAENPKAYERWIWMSHRIGSQLPQSLLSNSIQRLGEIDLLCRSMEVDFLARPPLDGALDFRFQHLSALSDWWASSAYAICFVLRTREILSDQDFVRLANDLRLVRVQNEKHELPSDRKIDDPLDFIPSPLRTDETTPPVYAYDKNDRLRAHIPRSGLSAARSKMWEVFDPSTLSARWVDRLELANRMLDLMSPKTGGMNA